jgi:undecaprenyl-diphosphatase
MALLQIVILAIVQGVGEFLPISSSGHVVVLAALFDQFGEPLEEKLTVNIVLHLGTLLAILVVYWRRVVRLLGQDRRVIGLLLAGSLPAAVVGILFQQFFQASLESALVAGLMFPVTGVLLLSTKRVTVGSLSCRQLSYWKSITIGAFQAFAILPGISRSGATIVAGLRCGLSREEAATFSFLLAIPAIAGAGLLEGIKLASQSPAAGALGLLALGGGLSFAVGLVSLVWLLRWLKQGRLHCFAWWVLLLGPAVVVWQLWFS